MKHTISDKKKLTALALTQPQERIPVFDYTNVIRLDREFNVKITDCIENYSLTKTANTIQIN